MFYNILINYHIPLFEMLLKTLYLDYSITIINYFIHENKNQILFIFVPKKYY